MSRQCDISGSKTSHGGNRKHRRGRSGAGGPWRYKSTRTTRTWEPNLRKAKVLFNGVIQTVKVKMSIYNKLRKGDSVNGYTLVPAYTPSAKVATK